MDDLAMLLAELERCKAEFEHLQTELNSPRGAGPVQPTTLQDLARRMSEIAARLEAEYIEQFRSALASRPSPV
jgi:hypothetical protein